jgi:class 3 adenylate cyclase
LVLGNTSARFLVSEDYPIGFPEEAIDAFVSFVGREWGSPSFLHVVSSGGVDDAVGRMWMNQLRSSATPRNAAEQYRYLLKNIDVRESLPLVQAPTLVLHSRDNPFFGVEHGRYLADHIAGAKLVVLPGSLVDLDSTESSGGSEITEFLTGHRPPLDVDRVLTTVMFTDIVGSTRHAASMGDRRWRGVLEVHDRLVRDELRRFRGQEISNTGDGFMASFDGPARAIRCAREICAAADGLGIEVRAGLHLGECEIRGDALGGLTVHIAARIGSLASAREVLVSGTVKDSVAGTGIAFADQREHELKGVPGKWRLFSVNATQSRL